LTSYRWIYKLLHMWTVVDYDAIRRSMSDNIQSASINVGWHVVCRWIYKLPHTWTEADYDTKQAAPGDLAYSHMAMITQLPDGRLGTFMQVCPFCSSSVRLASGFLGRFQTRHQMLQVNLEGARECKHSRVPFFTQLPDGSAP